VPSAAGPTTIAIIPARGGSKGVPGKNVADVGGVPLVGRAVHACRRAGIELVVVSTDSDRIAAAGRDAGAVIIERPDELATDEATSESTLLHALDALEADGVEPGVLAFVQCTSPFIDPEALRAAVEVVRDGEADCAFSATETHEFLWRVRGDGSAGGVNHDPSVRPRRQDREAHWRETGAFYTMDVAGFRAAGHRFFGRVRIVPVAAADAIEIDSLEELELARSLVRFRPPPTVPALGDVQLLVTDFDGVHTDDRVSVDETGREQVTVSRRDGHGVSELRRAGIPVIILSKERNPVVARRAEKLQVEFLHGIDDKLPALQEWVDRLGIDAEHVAYLGNDINDVECMRWVGVACAPADAHPSALDVAAIVTEAPGGHGAVREVADRILRARGADAARREG